MPSPDLGQAELDSALGDADVGDRREFEAAAEGVAGQRGDQRHAQPRQRLEGAMAGARPVAPHVERRQAAPGGDVAAGAERLALADEDRDARLARRLDRRAASASASIIARSSALSLSARFSVRRASGPSKASSTMALIGARLGGRSSRPIGSGWNKRRRPSSSDAAATRSGNSACARTSRFEIDAGRDLGRPSRPRASSRITQRSVT